MSCSSSRARNPIRKAAHRLAIEVKVKLYSIAISHPARAAGLMLRYKGTEHEIVDILPGMQRALLRLHGFRGATVPAMKIDGRKVQGSLNVSRALEELQPEPPLFPSDPEQRAAVEEAERWGEAELQPVPRNIFRWFVTRDYELRRNLAETSGMPLPALAGRLTKPVGWYFAHVVSGASEESVRSELAALPALLDHVDELIADGVIGNEHPNAADFQIATSIRVLHSFPQLQALIDDRPAAELATRIAPNFGLPVPLQIPAEWVPEPVLSS
jgi:glutathione S-transferase